MTKKLTEFAPLGLALALSLLHIIPIAVAPEYTDQFGRELQENVIDSVVIGAVGLAIVVTLYMLKQSVWKYAFLILILLSFSDFVEFSNHSFFLGIVGVEVNILSAALLISHLLLNLGMISSLSVRWGSDEKSTKERDKRQRIESEWAVQNFERKFASKKEKELQQMLEQKDLVPEAKEAAKRLLQQDKNLFQFDQIKLTTKSRSRGFCDNPVS